MNKFIEWLKQLRGIIGKKNPVTPNQEPAAGPQTLWPAYYSATYLDHGYEGEDDMRDSEIAKCAEGRTGCLAMLMKRLPSFPFAIEVLDWESDKRKGYFKGIFHKRCLAVGITKFQIHAAAVAGDLVGLYDFFKHYPAGSVQFVIGRPFSKNDMATLKCDSQGVKVSGQELRK
jgi:hypothetical protein